MASGNMHALATTIVAGIVGPGLVFGAGQHVSVGVASMLGCLLGQVVMPDLDVRHRPIHSQAIVRRTVGYRVFVVWYLLWLPYAYLIPHHRHWLGHLPFLGTVIRLVYLLAVPALIWYGISSAFYLPILPSPLFLSLGLWVFGGLALVDTVHFLMDQV